MAQIELFSPAYYTELLDSLNREVQTNESVDILVGASSDFNFNGLVLNPTSCILEQELNGVWELSITMPVDDERSAEVVENAVLKINTPSKKNQLYRINYVEKNDNTVSATAYPVFLDAGDEVFLFDNRPTLLNGQEALDWMMNGTIYSGYSDIAKISTAYYENKNLIEAISSDDDNSFLKRWGGEIYYDNYTIDIVNRLGADNYVRVETGLNMTGIKESIDMSELTTRFVPQAFNGYMLEEGYYDSPLISNYPKVFTKKVDCKDMKLQSDAGSEETGYETLEALRNAMKHRCDNLMLSGKDKPKITYDISMVDLSKTDKYQDYAALLKIHLGDVVHCHHNRLNITTDARVVKLTWDCVYEEVTNIVLGQMESSYYKKITEAVSTINEVVNVEKKKLIADRIEGSINMFETVLRAQKDVANKQDVRAILFEDTDTDSPTYGAMCLGTQGFQIADSRNVQDTDWDWTTLGTAKGFYATNIIGNHITGYKIDASEFIFGDESASYVKAHSNLGNDGVEFIGNGSFDFMNKSSTNLNELFMNGNNTMNTFYLRNYKINSNLVSNTVELYTTADTHRITISNYDFTLTGSNVAQNYIEMRASSTSSPSMRIYNSWAGQLYFGTDANVTLKARNSLNLESETYKIVATCTGFVINGKRLTFGTSSSGNYVSWVEDNE